MLKRLRIIYQVQLREVQRISQRPIYAFCMLVVPLFCMFFFLHLMSDGLPDSLPIAVVDQDNSVTSRSLTLNIGVQQQSSVKIRTYSFGEARAAMQRGEVYGIFLIPKDFGRNVITGMRPQVSYYYNASYLMAGSLTFKDMKMMSELVNGKVIVSFAEAHGVPIEVAMAQVQPVKVTSHLVGNQWLNYSIYLNNAILPGMLQLMIFLVTVYSIGTEIKYRSSHEWLRTSRQSISLGLFGKLSVHYAIFFAVGLLMLSVLYGYLHFPMQNGWLPVIVAMAFLILAAQSMGIFFITILPTLRLGLSFATLMGMLSFSLAGFSFPLSAMPPAVQALAYLFPLRHYFLIYADQALNGVPIHYSIPAYVALVAFAFLPMLLMRRLKRALIEFRYIP